MLIEKNMLFLNTEKRKQLDLSNHVGQWYCLFGPRGIYACVLRKLFFPTLTTTPHVERNRNLPRKEDLKVDNSRSGDSKCF